MQEGCSSSRYARTYHRYQQGWLASRDIINPAAIRDEAELLHHGKEVLDYSLHGLVHVA